MTEPSSLHTKHFTWCSYCDRAVNATEVGVVEHYDGGESGPPSRITLLRCDVCEQAFVCAQEMYSGDDDWDEMERVWPRPVRRLSDAVPVELQAEHREARKCFDAKAYTAAAVMVRRTLEGVCSLHGIKERALYLSLKVMQERGLLDPRLLEWAQELRVIGNEGAHFTGKQLARADAADALALSEALLDYIYVLTAKFEEFKTRRATKANGGSPSPTESTT